MNDFKQVIQYSNWGYWDQLDEVTLKDGELIEVQYPDGTIELTRVEMEDRRIHTSDMGSPYTISNCIAYGRFQFHGADARLGLRGMLARRVEEP